MTSRDRFRRLVFVIRECVALLFWILVIVKIFVYDVEGILIGKIRWIEQLYQYRFFLLMGFAAILWLSLGTKKFFKTLAYLTLYPFVFFLWRIPKLLFRNWRLLLIAAPALESILATLKWRFICASFTLLAALGIAISTSRLSLIACMSILLVFLLFHVVFRLRAAFRPQSIFSNLAPGLRVMWQGSIKSYETSEIQARGDGEEEPQAYQKKHLDNLKNLYMNNLFWAFLAQKLDRAVSSRITDVYFLLALLYSFTLAVTVFGFEYFALFKIDSTSFGNVASGSFWSFLLFSFNAMLHAPFATVIPVSSWALALANLETVSGALIAVFFVFILLTSSRERYRQELKDVVELLTLSALEIEKFFQDSLCLRLIDAEIKFIENDPQFSLMLESFGRMPPQAVDADQKPRNANP